MLTSRWCWRRVVGALDLSLVQVREGERVLRERATAGERGVLEREVRVREGRMFSSSPSSESESVSGEGVRWFRRRVFGTERRVGAGGTAYVVCTGEVER